MWESGGAELALSGEAGVLPGAEPQKEVLLHLSHVIREQVTLVLNYAFFFSWQMKPPATCLQIRRGSSPLEQRRALHGFKRMVPELQWKWQYFIVIVFLPSLSHPYVQCCLSKFWQCFFVSAWCLSKQEAGKSKCLANPHLSWTHTVVSALLLDANKLTDIDHRQQPLWWTGPGGCWMYIHVFPWKG